MAVAIEARDAQNDRRATVRNAISGDLRRHAHGATRTVHGHVFALAADVVRAERRDFNGIRTFNERDSVIAVRRLARLRVDAAFADLRERHDVAVDAKLDAGTTPRRDDKGRRDRIRRGPVMRRDQLGPELARCREREVREIAVLRSGGGERFGFGGGGGGRRARACICGRRGDHDECGQRERTAQRSEIETIHRMASIAKFTSWITPPSKTP